MKRLRITLWAIAALFTALAGVVLLAPSRPPAPLAPSGAETPGTEPVFTAGDPSFAEDVVVANVFSARRTPPRSRYSPADEGTGANGMMPADSLVAPEASGLEGTQVPVLFGTVVGTSGTLALLQLDPTASGPRLYAVGERDGGYRVVSIAPRSVVVTGPRGRVTLRLDREEERP